MNIVFWALLIMALFLFWVCCSVAFRAIGNPVTHMMKTVQEEIEQEGEKEKEHNDDKR